MVDPSTPGTTPDQTLYICKASWLAFSAFDRLRVSSAVRKLQHFARSQTVIGSLGNDARG